MFSCVLCIILSRGQVLFVQKCHVISSKIVVKPGILQNFYHRVWQQRLILARTKKKLKTLYKQTFVV